MKFCFNSLFVNFFVILCLKIVSFPVPSYSRVIGFVEIWFFSNGGGFIFSCERVRNLRWTRGRKKRICHFRERGRLEETSVLEKLELCKILQQISIFPRIIYQCKCFFMFKKLYDEFVNFQFHVRWSSCREHCSTYLEKEGHSIEWWSQDDF